MNFEGKLKPCPFCGEQPEVSFLGSCIDIECCCSMSLQKCDVVSRKEIGDFNYETGLYSDVAEEKAMDVMIERWNAMKIEGDYVIFSTENKRYANGGIIGIDPDLYVTHGSDGGIYDPDDPGDTMFADHKLSKADLLELADYMIEQWQKFRALHEVVEQESPCEHCNGTGDVHRADGEYLGACDCGVGDK